MLPRHAWRCPCNDSHRVRDENGVIMAYVEEPHQVDITIPSGANDLGATLRELLNVVLLTLILFFTLRSVILNFRVTGSSMEPTFHDGDYVFVYRLAYWRRLPHRGDVVVFRYPANPKRTLIKRVVGLPGETVSVHDGQVYINSIPLPEPYIAAPPEYVAAPVRVGKGEIYVLGDNRNNSNDSHVWGLLKTDYLVGKVVWRYWPVQRVGLISHADYPPPLNRLNPQPGSPGS